jgi:hypothetical protein
MTLLKIQTEVIVWYSGWQKPMHAPCQDACSVLTVHVSTKYFNKRNNNYTKTILQSHTDHYPNTTADMFSHGSQERVCYCPGCLLQVSCFHHTSTNLTLEKNTCICWMGGRVGRTASLDIVEKRKITCPYQHLKLWRTNQGTVCFLLGNSLVSGVHMPMFRNTLLFHLHR